MTETENLAPIPEDIMQAATFALFGHVPDNFMAKASTKDVVLIRRCARALLAERRRHTVEAGVGKPFGYVYEDTVTYFDGRGKPRQSSFSKTRRSISPDDTNEFEITETAVYAAPTPPSRAEVTPEWQPIETAPKGCVTEDAGCRGASEWFLGRVAEKYRPFRPPFIVIRRRGWPQDEGWECAGEANYVPGFFDAWQPLPAGPALGAGKKEAGE